MGLSLKANPKSHSQETRVKLVLPGHGPINKWVTQVYLRHVLLQRITNLGQVVLLLNKKHLQDRYVTRLHDNSLLKI